MHFEFMPDDGTGRTVLRALPDPSDETPRVDSLVLDACPTRHDADLVAAAATLLYSRFATETLSFPSPIPQPLADAIHNATGLQVGSAITPAEPEPLEEQDAGNPQVTTLEVSLTSEVPPRTPGVDRTRLCLVAGDRFQGALHGVKESLIASNAWYLASTVEPSDVRYAVGLLFSRDFLAREVVAGDSGSDGSRPSELALLLGASIGLTVS